MITKMEFAFHEFRTEESLPGLGVRAICTTTPRMRRKVQIRHIQGEGNVIKLLTDNHTPTSQPKR